MNIQETKNGLAASICFNYKLNFLKLKLEFQLDLAKSLNSVMNHLRVKEETDHTFHIERVWVNPKKR